MPVGHVHPEDVDGERRFRDRVHPSGSCSDLNSEPEIAMTGEQVDSRTLLAKKIEVKKK